MLIMDIVLKWMYLMFIMDIGNIKMCIIDLI
jgi:hypothetical protein